VTLTVDGAAVAGDFEARVDLVVQPGETVALVGPNGAGKTTALRAIAGLEPLAYGRISFAGEVWDDGTRFVPPAGRRVGVVFQQHLLFEHLSAVDNVAFGVRPGRRPTGADRRRAEALLDRLGVGSVGAQRPSELSGGQAQRVAIARALAIQPSVVLLDEPMAALDVSARAGVRHELADWLSDMPDAARILVTHDPVDADALADRVIVMEAGRVTQRGTLPELAAAPRTNYVADLLGTNLVRGVLAGNVLLVEGGGELVVAPHDVADGPAVAAVAPRAVALHRDRPSGSPRNVWSSRVVAIERSSGRVRVRLGAPLPIVVEVTDAGLDALGVGAGDMVWASVKATEIVVTGD